MDEQQSEKTSPPRASLLQQIKSQLRAQHLPVLQTLHVEVNGDIAVIQGTVKTYYERQVALECCKRVAGVNRVIDLIGVGNARHTLVTHEPFLPACELYGDSPDPMP